MENLNDFPDVDAVAVSVRQTDEAGNPISPLIKYLKPGDPDYKKAKAERDKLLAEIQA